ncbi:unnamed protein product [Kuraishia capsulata CBS 1993]|uniref:Amino acid permease/ SLC12A domain-containing protein n=1 Tax=Kuraishia capsulata CBS 1993 TaxID=1382522 RepID=W6MTW0_9ASCO|nr:uncharacterized protein KUCA_T00004686001 [Kuraishia capsulata CBS 1993]CDK28702.1 unnamed protein product [Kuraishia capsulata CBS 1993]
MGRSSRVLDGVLEQLEPSPEPLVGSSLDLNQNRINDDRLDQDSFDQERFDQAMSETSELLAKSYMDDFETVISNDEMQTLPSKDNLKFPVGVAEHVRSYSSAEEEEEVSTTIRPADPGVVESYRDVSHLQELEDLPHGRHLGVFSVMILLITRIVGSGIFATPALIYRDVGGSPALFFLVWITAALMSFSGLFVFLELGSILPRSGGTKVFLEYAYNRPYMLMSVVFNIYSILFGFTITNTLIFGKYIIYSLGFDDASETSARYVGLTLVVLVTVIHGVSTKYGVLIQNYTGGLKLFLLVAMAFIGLYVMVLPSSWTHIENQMESVNFFKATSEVSFSSFISGLLKAIFSLAGWNSAHVVSSEMKDPVKTMRIAGPLAMGIVVICYMFINIAYLIVIPSEDLMGSGELVGSLLFEKLFGYKIGRQFLTATVAASAAGNIVAVLYGVSRMNQEVFREGFLPFSKFFASNRPFQAPFPALLIPLVISSVFLLLPIPGDLYDYIVNLEGYPGQIFIGLASAAVFLIRRRRPGYVAPIRAPSIGVIFMILLSVFLFFGPLVPHKGGKEFQGYPNYAVTGLVILALCALYWAVMFEIMPRIRNYDLVQTQEVLSDGMTIKVWKKDFRAPHRGLV